MSVRRCASCGALVGPDAEWCTQCFARLDRPPVKEPVPAGRPETPALRAGLRRAGVRATTEGIVWACPMCGSENPIEVTTCGACGTPFGKLFEDHEPKPQVDPGRAAAFSLLFPGLGHIVAGRWADGLARAVIFAYALVTAITVLVTGARAGAAVFLLIASIAMAAGLYAVSAADAARTARDEPPLLGARLLLYGSAGLILLTVIVMVIAGARAG